MDWGDIPEQSKSNGGGKGKLQFLRMEKGKEYKLRFFHKPMALWRYYVNKKSAVTLDPKNCPIQLKNYKGDDGEPLKPKDRYVIQCIDRADGEFKLLENGPQVFGALRKFAQKNQIDPGGNDAPDFTIDVTGNLPNYYDVTPGFKATPFTPEEIAMLKEKKVDLTQIIKPTPDIEEHLFPNASQGDSDDSPKSTESAQADDGGDDSDDVAVWS
jgi:hypothetical protein